MNNYITKNIILEDKDKEYKEYIILIGRNSLGNEEIIKISHPESIWLHFENISGPHIIIQNHNDDIIDKKQLRQVALFLFEYKKSAPKNSSVIYCKIKDLKLTRIQGCVNTKNTKTLKF